MLSWVGNWRRCWNSNWIYKCRRRNRHLDLWAKRMGYWQWRNRGRQGKVAPPTSRCSIQWRNSKRWGFQIWRNRTPKWGLHKRWQPKNVLRLRHLCWMSYITPQFRTGTLNMSPVVFNDRVFIASSRIKRQKSYSVRTYPQICSVNALLNDIWVSTVSQRTLDW